MQYRRIDKNVVKRYKVTYSIDLVIIIILNSTPTNGRRELGARHGKTKMPQILVFSGKKFIQRQAIVHFGVSFQILDYAYGQFSW